MFTGLVEELGRIEKVARNNKALRLTINAKRVVEGISLGDSIAVNGTCLTVVEFGNTWFTAEAMPETVERTMLGRLKAGDLVNLERTLRIGDRLGGHIVTGHIDGTGRIEALAREDNAVVVKVSAAPEILRYVVKKGSIAIDGISLTVVDLGDDWFTVSTIPHTRGVTTLGLKREGDLVNLETDIIGKYVERLLTAPLTARAEAAPKIAITEAFLREHGFM